VREEEEERERERGGGIERERESHRERERERDEYIHEYLLHMFSLFALKGNLILGSCASHPW